MAVTIAISFLLVIPIEPIDWLLALPAGPAHRLLRQPALEPRAGRGAGSSPTRCFAGVVTGLTTALLLLGVKALFFFADNGYRDPGLGGSHRPARRRRLRLPALLEAGRGPDLAAAGVTDADVVHAFYWREQFGTRRPSSSYDGGGLGGRRAVRRVPPEAAADRRCRHEPGDCPPPDLAAAIETPRR